MKKISFLLSTIVLVMAFSFNACKKDKEPAPTPEPIATNHFMNGLGTTPGFPSGTQYVLPAHVQVIGQIRGGQYYKDVSADKGKYNGNFPLNLVPKSWVSYGTGTYVQLYMQLYNTLTVDTTLIIPGGLIFCDSLDNDSSNGFYQRGFILQNVSVLLPASDTAFVALQAYCLNLSLSSSSYDAVYYIGPVSNNPNLNQIVTIMAPKQYPFGNEGMIQNIIWNVTDYGQNLTSQEIQDLNALP